jgi:hypothetical protein
MDRRQRPGDRLTHHAPVHAEFGRDPGDRADTELVLLTELLEQFHSGFPIHSEPPGKTRVTVANHYIRFGDVALQLDLATVLGSIKDASRRCAVACGHP